MMGFGDHLAEAQPWGQGAALGSGDRDPERWKRWGLRTGFWDGEGRGCSSARPPEVSFQVRSACARGQVEEGMGAGGAGPSSGLLGKLLLKKVSEVGCSQEPAWQGGGRICDRAEGLEVPLRWAPWL